mmetsp:Transcript_20389/g.30155  ORF Transcript_20389/g.30155 Transcript_20389/m.30155 type:complete len:119 (+) Transcript_20389:195-551(+)
MTIAEFVCYPIKILQEAKATVLVIDIGGIVVVQAIVAQGVVHLGLGKNLIQKVTLVLAIKAKAKHRLQSHLLEQIHSHQKMTNLDQKLNHKQILSCRLKRLLMILLGKMKSKVYHSWK